MGFREDMQILCDSFKQCVGCQLERSCRLASDSNLPGDMTDKELAVLRVGLMELSKKLADMAVEE